MEKKIACKTSDNQMILDLSKVLVECGIDAAKNYYQADEYHVPYFKIPKQFHKEANDDPDVVYLFVDVDDNEYTVHGRYIHEHIGNERQVANLVMGLLSGAIAEVALVYPDRMAGFFMMNTGAPEKNIKVIDDNADYIMEHLFSPLASMSNVHGHMIFSAAHPYYLQYGASRQPQIQGVQVYMLSAVFGEHTEYYVIK